MKSPHKLNELPFKVKLFFGLIFLVVIFVFFKENENIFERINLFSWGCTVDLTSD